jgi:hypothetical protein
MNLRDGSVQWALKQLCDSDMGITFQHVAKVVIRREIRCVNSSKGRDLIDEGVGSNPVAGGANQGAQYLF